MSLTHENKSPNSREGIHCGLSYADGFHLEIVGGCTRDSCTPSRLHKSYPTCCGVAAVIHVQSSNCFPHAKSRLNQRVRDSCHRRKGSYRDVLDVRVDLVSYGVEQGP
jgi:hypothetical protein